MEVSDPAPQALCQPLVLWETEKEAKLMDTRFTVTEAGPPACTLWGFPPRISGASSASCLSHTPQTQGPSQSIITQCYSMTLEGTALCLAMKSISPIISRRQQRLMGRSTWRANMCPRAEIILYLTTSDFLNAGSFFIYNNQAGCKPRWALLEKTESKHAGIKNGMERRVNHFTLLTREWRKQQELWLGASEGPHLLTDWTSKCHQSWH